MQLEKLRKALRKLNYSDKMDNGRVMKVHFIVADYIGEKVEVSRVKVNDYFSSVETVAVLNKEGLTINPFEDEEVIKNVKKYMKGKIK